MEKKMETEDRFPSPFSRSNLDAASAAKDGESGHCDHLGVPYIPSGADLADGCIGRCPKCLNYLIGSNDAATHTCPPWLPLSELAPSIFKPLNNVDGEEDAN